MFGYNWSSGFRKESKILNFSDDKEGWTSSDDNTSQPLKVSSSFKHTLINTWKTQQKLKFNDQLDACLNFFSLAVDLIQHKYLVILYNKIKWSIITCANKDKYDQSAINYIYTLKYLNPALKPMAASTEKSFGLKLYIHSMTDNIITTTTWTTRI
jgi:hypothetical protein